MVLINQAKDGVISYVMTEIVPHIEGWKKWAAGAAVTLIVNKADAYLELPAIKALGIVNDGMIDIDNLRKVFKEQAERTGPVSIDIPMLGVIKLNANDIDIIYQHIMNGGAVYGTR